MNPDPTLTRAADETAGRQPREGGRPGEAASAMGGSREPQPELNAQGFYTFDEMVPPSAAARGDTREARRTRRMNDLEIGRMLALQAIARLSDGMAGKLYGDAQAIVEKINDPYLAMSRMYQELRRIVALEERLDEDAEERAARLAAEAAAREQTVRQTEARRPANARSQALEDKKKAIRQAVTDAAHDAWGDDDLDLGGDDDDRDPRENLLDDLFDDYDTNESYKGDPVEIVAKLCTELGLKLPKDMSADPAVTEEARILELARGYLEQAGFALAPAPADGGHGPPDG